MKPWFIANDLHIGALRSGGTTPATATALRRHLLFGFSQLLTLADDCNLIINGDLFDATHVPLSDMYATMHMLADWLTRNHHSDLCMPPGNHDLSKNSETFSSFDFVANYLRNEFPTQVLVPREGQLMDREIWVIPHMPNQELFDLELAKVPACKVLFLHCNYDNKFAAQSDHSLNLSEDQATKLPAGYIVIGHEHQQKQALSGKVQIVGNQIPSSVADCLGNNEKCALKIWPDRIRPLEWIKVWDFEDSFLELDWKEIDPDSVGLPDFVRVVGTATAAEAAAVVAAISKLRQRSQSLVITNAVKIDGVSTEEMAVSLEQIQSFDVTTELLSFLDEDMRVVVKDLLERSKRA